MDATARRTKRAAERTAAAVPEALDAKVSETRSAATGVAGAVEGPLTGLEAYIWGQHAGSAFAQGLASQAATAEAAAQRARRGDPRRHRLQPARHGPGPLATIRSWGPHLVATWLGGHRAPRRRRRADRVPARGCHEPATPGTRLGGCEARPAGGPCRRCAGRSGGGEVHLHIGTLIADERGLDELDRRLDLRRRLRGRSRPRAS